MNYDFTGLNEYEKEMARGYIEFGSLNRALAEEGVQDFNQGLAMYEKGIKA